MANNVKYTWFGVQVYFDEATIEGIKTALKDAGSANAVMAGALAFLGAPTVVATIAEAVDILALVALDVCDAAKKGVIITVLWIGAPWCTSQ